MQEDRRYAAEIDEDGGGGDEEYEINSMGRTSEDCGKRDVLRRCAGSGGKGN